MLYEVKQSEHYKSKFGDAAQVVLTEQLLLLSAFIILRKKRIEKMTKNLTQANRRLWIN